ncbi:putative protein kinase RLK-Pelle-DLSV family [Rosa chinensis]|uniref:non-specific serine/threonine protein kinase n=1 Tax=Rosa chinensis TaxID=74649 RepID=A0A2P6RCW5_ROSCH|nr:putative protein kinase RLK-Pelle-DLSV family [Rosa chinensis]
MVYDHLFTTLRIFLLLYLPSYISIVSITPNQTIKDGDVLVSSRKLFALGFFSRGNSGKRYVGRDNPVNDSSGLLVIDADGGLGVHSSGTEMAMKRLSKSSGQGNEEFKNEVMLIVKLQPKNLVRILGYCVQDEEKMLIYEYLPNKSLDLFIFNEMKRTSLDWTIRLEIIFGIAKGILFLHQDSRLRIIHRDLKASNILLDYDMNLKIADFGVWDLWKEGRALEIIDTSLGESYP